MQDSGMVRFRQILRKSRPTSDVPGVAIQVEYQGLRQQVLTFPKRKPFAFAIGLNAVVCVGADWFCQLYEETKENERKADWRRSCVFFCFGAMQGALSYYVYLNVFSKLCPHSIRFSNSPWSQKLMDKAGQRDLWKQVALDSFAYVPFLYFPNFYMIRSFLYNNTEEGSSPDVVSACSAGLGNYKRTFLEDNFLSSMCWLPADAVIFCCKPWLRLPLSISVNLFWATFLSSLRGRDFESSVVGQ